MYQDLACRRPWILFLLKLSFCSVLLPSLPPAPGKGVASHGLRMVPTGLLKTNHAAADTPKAC